MLLQIRRPVRPEPVPLRERTSRAACSDSVWLSVRHKRRRQVASLARKAFPHSRGLPSSPHK